MLGSLGALLGGLAARFAVPEFATAGLLLAGPPGAWAAIRVGEKLRAHL